MLKLRINPIVVKDLKNIRDYIAEDNEAYAAKTIKEIYGKFENMGRLCNYLQGRKRICGNLSSNQPISGYYENL